jgi:osmotically-inducible protein OsmY
MDQSNESRDVEITAEIRRAIVDDSAMSTNARNIKIITDKGAVTLRGVVDSQAEKTAIEEKAKAVSGVVSVDNQLEVKTP